MRKLSFVLLFMAGLLGVQRLAAQTPCPHHSVVVNTPEDELMLAINGAENPQDQLAALDKFSKEHADSKFMPCALEYFTITYLKLNNYDKAIESGEKDLADNYQSLSLYLNLLRAYVASGKASDTAFDVISKVPAEIKEESNVPRPPKATDEEWTKMQQELADTMRDNQSYAVYAFFQLIQRVPDGAKRAAALDKFTQAYPDEATKSAGQINFHYFLAYKMANQPDKAFEYGEKTVASDPNNTVAFNLLAYDYAFARPNPDKAAEYAKKALDLAEAMKKPDAMADADFKREQNNQLGMAHLTLGYASFVKASVAKTKKIPSTIQDLKAAGDLLDANPELQGQALYFLGSAYEYQFPANHPGAIDALGKASNITFSMQAQAKDLLGKVKKQAGQ